MRQPPIITTTAWGARAPRVPPTLVGTPWRIIVHGTAGHHPEISNPRNESRAEAIRYARDIQAFHMGPSRGWNDSGHNLLVCRNGLVLVGRRHSLTALRAGLMVISAHCPGQNDQPGIEFEHDGNELLTGEQLRAGVDVMAWICSRAGIRPTELEPHRRYFATDCPTNSIVGEIPKMRALVARRINEIGRHPATRVEKLRLQARARFGGLR